MSFKPRPFRGSDKKNDLQKIFSAHVADGTLEKGVEYFRSIVVQAPSHSLAWLLLARLREAQGDHEKAYTAFHESALAMQRSPKLPLDAKVSRFLDVARLCLEHGWPDRARLSLNAALALNPGHPGALQLRHQVDRDHKAAEQTQKSVPPAPPVTPQPIPPMRTPSRPGPQLVDAEDRGRGEEFAEPSGSGELVPELKRANAAFTQGDLDQAEQLFLEAIEKNPRLSGAHVGLAQTHARRDRYDLTAVREMSLGIAPRL